MPTPNITKNLTLRKYLALFFLLIIYLLPQSVQAESGCLAENEISNSSYCRQIVCCDESLGCEEVYKMKNVGRGEEFDFHTGARCVIKTDYKAPDNPVVDNAPDIEQTDVIFKPQVSIPGSITIAGKTFQVKKGEGMVVDGDTFANYFRVFYQFFIAALAVAAVVMIMWSGFKRIMAAGNQETIAEANKGFFGALIGFVLALTSYTLLQLINPALVRPTSLQLYQIKKEEFTLETDEPVETPVDAPSALGTGDSNMVKIPENANIHLDGVAAAYPYLSAQTLEAFLKAAAMAGKQGITIQVNHALRTYQEQKRLYAKHCTTGKCIPDTCNPGNDPAIANCPHTTGSALDVVCQGKSSSNPCQAQLQKIMLEAGFCRLTSEAWHFEYPKRSRKCTIVK